MSSRRQPLLRSSRLQIWRSMVETRMSGNIKISTDCQEPRARYIQQSSQADSLDRWSQNLANLQTDGPRLHRGQHQDGCRLQHQTCHKGSITHVTSMSDLQQHMKAEVRVDDFKTEIWRRMARQDLHSPNAQD